MAILARIDRLPIDILANFIARFRAYTARPEA